MPNWGALEDLKREVQQISSRAELNSDAEKLADALIKLIELLLED